MSKEQSQRTDAWKKGYFAATICDNPYWKTYPKHESDEEHIRARQFVDGYVEKVKDAIRAEKFYD